MLEIAFDVSQQGVLQKDIAINQNISIKYLDYIIHALKVAGLIKNATGNKKGYILSRKPSTITMYDIHNAFEHDVCIVDCINSNSTCIRKKKCSVKYFWLGLNNIIIDYLKSTTLEDLVKQEYQNNQSIIIAEN